MSDAERRPIHGAEFDSLIGQRNLGLDAESEKRLHELLHALPAAVYTTDAFGRITFYNEAAAALWGCRPVLGSDEWCGSWRLFWPDGTPLPHSECPMAMAIKEKRPIVGMEAIAERPDGTRVPFMPFPSPLFDSAGKFVGAVNMLVDITERKRAEEASRQAERDLRDFLENAHMAIHWVGPDGTVLWANRAELQMLGYAQDEYVGHHIADFHADRHVIDDILRRLTSRETLTDYEARLICKDGAIRHVLINSSAFCEGGDFVHTGCFTRDITEQKRTQTQIAVLGREAEHRAKNILATVQATVHLSKANSAEDLKRAIEGRIQALANVHTLFVDSRWAGARLGDLVKQEIAAYSQGGDSRATIEGPDVLLEPGLAQAMGVALHELATNAAKYGALSVAAGHIRVKWSRVVGDRVVLRWMERNGPAVQRPTSSGFGTRVMETIIRGQPGGEIKLDWRADGLMCEIAIAA
ncbi:MAG: PAS domain S-box protein [Xanthobacteraceae bacterium]